MKIDYPATEHIPQLRALWTASFGDSDQVLDNFHATAFSPARCRCALVDGDGLTMYLTHGHHHSPDNLPPLAEGSVFLSGHTHVKLDKPVDGIRCLNPGSVSIPKDGSHSCLIFENGDFRFHIWED